MRLFVAVELDDAARRAIAAEQKRILSALGDGADQIRPVQPAQLHLTLVFLGDVEETRIPSVIDACSRPVEMAPFDAVFSSLGVFPPRGAPRALWIGVTDGMDGLVALQKEMAARLTRLTAGGDSAVFRPHLTLGRWRRSRSSDRGSVLALGASTQAARCCVDHATLYRSELPSVRHAGPAYTELVRANLTRAS